MSELVNSGVPIEIIDQERKVRLKQFTLSDAREIFDLINRNRRYLSQFGDTTSKKYKKLEHVVESIIHPKNPNRLRFAIRDRAGTYIGTINLTPKEDDRTQGEIGYYLGKEFQGNGYMTEAVKMLSDFAFKELGYKRLVANVHPYNKGSQSVLYRAGFKLEGTRDVNMFFTKSQTQ